MLGYCVLKPLLKIDDVKLIEIITTLFNKNRKNYGTRRLKEPLMDWIDMSVAIALAG